MGSLPTCRGGRYRRERALSLSLSLSLALSLCNVLSHFLVPSLCGCFPRSCVGNFGLCGGLGAREEEETHTENDFLHLRKQLTQLLLLPFEGASDHHNHLQGFPSKRSVSTFKNLIVCRSSEQSSDKISNRAWHTSTHTNKKGCWSIPIYNVSSNMELTTSPPHLSILCYCHMAAMTTMWSSSPAAYIIIHSFELLIGVSEY